MLAGGAEAPVCLLGVGGFTAMRALATGFNDEPDARQPAVRPRAATASWSPRAPACWCSRRSSTRRRAARRILAEVVGYGANCDAYHMTQPSPGGEGAAECMAQALDRRRRRARRGRLHQRARHRHAVQRRGRDAGDQARVRRARRAPRGELDEVDDRPPARRRRRRRGRSTPCWRSRAASSRRPSTSTSPIPRATSTTCRTRAREAAVDVALSNSFGFGGTNVCLAVRRADLMPGALLDRRLHFVVGKGGVGKTTVAAALALLLRAARPAHAGGRDGLDRAAARRCSAPTAPAPRRVPCRAEPARRCRSTGARRSRSTSGLIIPVKRLLHDGLLEPHLPVLRRRRAGAEGADDGRQDLVRGDAARTAARPAWDADRRRRAGDRPQPAVPAHAAGGARHLRRRAWCSARRAKIVEPAAGLRARRRCTWSRSPRRCRSPRRSRPARSCADPLAHAARLGGREPRAPPALRARRRSRALEARRGRATGGARRSSRCVAERAVEESGWAAINAAQPRAPARGRRRRAAGRAAVPLRRGVRRRRAGAARRRRSRLRWASAARPAVRRRS